MTTPPFTAMIVASRFENCPSDYLINVKQMRSTFYASTYHAIIWQTEVNCCYVTENTQRPAQPKKI